MSVSAIRTAIIVCACISISKLYAGQMLPTASQATVPKLVRISGTFRPVNGLPGAAVESDTLSIYKDDREGPPLWQETQNVALDADGRYNLLMGTTLTEGMPLNLFSAGEPRWLGVQFNRPGENEQPRVLLVSVPYALKAADAETLGGKPASDFLLSPAAADRDGAASTTDGKSSNSHLRPRVTSGSANCIAVFTSSTDLGCSDLTDSSGFVGLNTSSPLHHFHVRFSDA